MERVNTKSVLILRPRDLVDVVTMAEAIDLVEQGYREASEFPLINAPRRRVHSRKNVRVSSFPGGIDGLGVIGSLTRAESVAHDPKTQVYPYREHPVYVLWDSQTSELLAILIGEIAEKSIGSAGLMALRTAATSGVGFRHLVRKNARRAGVYGTGAQALHKVLALRNERRIERYQVFSRNPDNRKKFCERMSRIVDAEFIALDNPRDVPKRADVVICATNSNVPVFDGNWLEEGTHVVTVVGSNSALVKGGWLQSGRRENDDVTVERASFIITNWRESRGVRAAGRPDGAPRKRHHRLGQDPRAGRARERRIPRPHARRRDHVSRQQQRYRGGRPRHRQIRLRPVQSRRPRRRARPPGAGQPVEAHEPLLAIRYSLFATRA